MLDDEMRIAAALEIAAMGEIEVATRYLKALARDASVDEEHRMKAAREIAKLGDNASAIDAFATVTEDWRVLSRSRIELDFVQKLDKL